MLNCVGLLEQGIYKSPLKIIATLRSTKGSRVGRLFQNDSFRYKLLTFSRLFGEKINKFFFLRTFYMSELLCSQVAKPL